MSVTPTGHPVPLLEQSRQRLWDATRAVMDSTDDGQSSVTFGGWGSQRDLRRGLRHVGSAVDALRQSVGSLALASDGGWADHVRPALYTAYCALDETRWLLGINVRELGRGRPGRAAATDEADEVCRAVDAVRADLELATAARRAAALTQEDVGVVLLVLCEVVSVMHDLVKSAGRGTADASWPPALVSVDAATMRLAEAELAVTAALAALYGDEGQAGTGPGVDVDADGLGRRLAAVAARIEPTGRGLRGVAQAWVSGHGAAARMAHLAGAVRVCEQLVAMLEDGLEARWSAAKGERAWDACRALADAASVIGIVAKSLDAAPVSGRTGTWVGAEELHTVVAELAACGWDGSALTWRAATGEMCARDVATKFQETAAAVDSLIGLVRWTARLAGSLDAAAVVGEPVLQEAGEQMARAVVLLTRHAQRVPALDRRCGRGGRDTDLDRAEEG